MGAWSWCPRLLLLLPLLRPARTQAESEFLAGS